MDEKNREKIMIPYQVPTTHPGHSGPTTKTLTHLFILCVYNSLGLYISKMDTQCTLYNLHVQI